MINLKTTEEIFLMREANQLVGRTLAEIARHITPGVSTLQLDKIAHDFICDHGATPAFLGYAGFPGSICTSVNDRVVHGIPRANDILKEGDIVSVDCGTKLNGFTGDSAYTFAVGQVPPEVLSLLRTTKESLYKGIEQAVSGNRVGHISSAVQYHAEKAGYGVVRELVGHGIGRDMHESPEVPNYGRKGTGALLRNGMCICIEPMINMGSKNVVFDNDGWTVRTKDGKYSAHFEHCIAITQGRAEILSSFDYIAEVLGDREF